MHRPVDRLRYGPLSEKIVPEPINSRRRYMPGLDGLRAVAVLGVIVYHLGIDALPGGLLGVSVFFTLSGYLITDLILEQHRRNEFSLRSFWVARARRLLPALFVMLLVVAAWVTAVGPHQGTEFRTAAATAVAYVNNWWLVFRDVSYFAQFDAPGPLNHLWSLSVEEQFYVIWPLLVVAALALIPERPRSLRPRTALVLLGLTGASALLMTALFEPGADPSRVYYGTDTRAAELLMGGALAMIWPSQRIRAEIPRGARALIEGGGVAGLAVITAMFLFVGEFSSFLYRGGFVLLSIGVALTTASLAHPASRLDRIIGARPMRWIGARSYGIYLWHFPIIVLTTPEGSASPGLVRGALQVAATFAVAALSWRFIEEPIRHGALGRLWRQWRQGTLRRNTDVSPARLVAFVAAGVVIVVAAAGFAGWRTEDSGPIDDRLAVTEDFIAEPPSGMALAAPPERVRSAPDPVVTDDETPGPCTSVVYVGGSTSLGLLSDVYLPDESQQLSAQFASIGVSEQHYEIAGGRAIIEGYRSNPPAEESAQKWRDSGFRGCWVFALGTMDAANFLVGSPFTLSDRIERMMAIADGDPVLWVNVKTIATKGSWRSEVMPPWNEALREACGRYDNLRVYDWASEVEDSWFEPDGIHQNGPGYAHRAERIAAALAKAFPGPGVAVQAPGPGAACEFGL
jgi:peptidoglycan/LPS O-acetylase OafA/YrhL